jgi:hypothetical protein
MTLDVLLLGVADTRDLEAAGHRIHRCVDPDANGSPHPSGWLPCRALTAGECPLDGPVDVALVTDVHDPGVRCAARARVPVVDAATDDLVAVCEAAAVEAFAPVVDRMRSVCAALLGAHGVDPSEMTATFEVDRTRLAIRLSGPPLPPRVQRALCDRAVDALRAVPRSFSTIDASYRVG